MSFSALPLSYCTNVHAGRTVQEVDHGLDEYTVQIRQQTGQQIAAGLWLSRSVVSELLESDDALNKFRDRLSARELPCYTLNTFPYGDFHSERVKENVYLPDWTTDDRQAYTIDCARVLASLLPEDTEGSMSTLPLGGRMNAHGPDFHAACFEQLTRTAVALKQLHEETGRFIRLAIEPEPCCEISSIPDLAVPVFRQLRTFAADKGALEEVTDFIGLCFDVCHQAVEFEDVSASIDLLEANAIRINKVHISSAIELTNPGENIDGRRALAQYVEPRYLHQTYARCDDGRILTRVDLDERDVLRNESDFGEFDRAEAWRIHFHVPVNAERLGPLGTTRQELREALIRVAQLQYSPHLEIETYTWEILPGQESVSLVAGLSQEVEATRELLKQIDA